MPLKTVQLPKPDFTVSGKKATVRRGGYNAAVQGTKVLQACAPAAGLQGERGI